jgi:hypothetical protein
MPRTACSACWSEARSELRDKRGTPPLDIGSSTKRTGEEDAVIGIDNTVKRPPCRNQDPKGVYSELIDLFVSVSQDVVA